VLSPTSLAEEIVPTTRKNRTISLLREPLDEKEQLTNLPMKLSKLSLPTFDGNVLC